MNDYFALKTSSSLSNETKETLSMLYYDNKISRFAKDFLLTPKKPSSAAYTAKIEYDLEKKMRSSRLTPSTKEKMNFVFNQLFQKKETVKKANRVIHNEAKKGEIPAIKDFYMLLQKDSKNDRRNYCLTDTNRISLFKKGIEKVLTKENIVNKPIVRIKRNEKDELKAKEFFKTFFKSEISKRNKQQETEDKFYHNTVNEAMISKKKSEVYDKEVNMIKNRMMLYGVSTSKK